MWNVGLDANETHSHLGLRLGACHVASLLSCHTVVLTQHIGIVTLALLFLDGVLFIYHIPYLGPVCRPAPGGPIDPKLLQNAPFWCKTDFLKFFLKSK